MRKQLKSVLDKEVECTCFFNRYGTRSVNGKKRKTIVLQDVCILCGNKNIYVDHIWLRSNKRIEKLGILSNGDTLSFNATIKKYFKSGGSIEIGVKSVKNLKKTVDF